MATAMEPRPSTQTHTHHRRRVTNSSLRWPGTALSAALTFYTVNTDTRSEQAKGKSDHKACQLILFLSRSAYTPTMCPFVRSVKMYRITLDLNFLFFNEKKTLEKILFTRIKMISAFLNFDCNSTNLPNNSPDDNWFPESVSPSPGCKRSSISRSREWRSRVWRNKKRVLESATKATSSLVLK